MPPTTASSVHFAHLAAHGFHDLNLVCVNHLNLRLVTHKSRTANVCQRRSEFHVVGSKLPGGATFLECIPGIERGLNRKVIRFEARLPAKAAEKEAPAVEKSGFAPDQRDFRKFDGKLGGGKAPQARKTRSSRCVGAGHVKDERMDALSYEVTTRCTARYAPKSTCSLENQNWPWMNADQHGFFRPVFGVYPCSNGNDDQVCPKPLSP